MVLMAEQRDVQVHLRATAWAGSFWRGISDTNASAVQSAQFLRVCGLFAYIQSDMIQA